MYLSAPFGPRCRVHDVFRERNHHPRAEVGATISILGFFGPLPLSPRMSVVAVHWLTIPLTPLPRSVSSDQIKITPATQCPPPARSPTKTRSFPIARDPGYRLTAIAVSAEAIFKNAHRRYLKPLKSRSICRSPAAFLNARVELGRAAYFGWEGGAQPETLPANHHEMHAIINFHDGKSALRCGRTPSFDAIVSRDTGNSGVLHSSSERRPRHAPPSPSVPGHTAHRTY